MSAVISILAAAFAFGIMIAFHEFGHFVCAKLSGIQVNEFSIGMGPAILKKIWHGTQYSLRVLPIGGFVAMEGEDSAGEGADDEAEQDAAETADASDAAALKKSEAEEEAAYNPIPPEQRTGKPFPQVSVPKRFVTVAAGALMNFVLAFLVLLFLVSGQDAITSKTVYSIDEGALCGQTGLQPDDKILAVNGRKCYVANDIVYELARTEDYSADFTVLRGGETVELENVQFDTWTDESGGIHMKLGFIVYGVKKTVKNVLIETFNSERYYGRIVFSSLQDLLRGRASINDLSGPVGIVTAISEAVSYSIEDFLTLLALLSVNLGIFNLLPLPALDGGKLVFLVWEGITHRPVSTKVQEYTSIIGLALLLTLMLFATYNDIIRLIAGRL